jgi:hypothetical protein
MSLMSLPPYKFASLPCCYYSIQGTEIYGIGLDNNGIIFLPIYMKIGPTGPKLKSDRVKQTDTQIQRRVVISKYFFLFREGNQSCNSVSER